MKQFTKDELGVLIELVRSYARACESDYYEAHYAGKPKIAKRMKQRWEAMDDFYDRIIEMFEENFNMSANTVDTMRLEDMFEQHLIETFKNAMLPTAGQGKAD